MKFRAKDVAYIGVAAASLTAVKFALSWLANVELVTLLLLFYTLLLGRNRAFFVANIFIVVEVVIFGVGAWVVSYILHWNALVILTSLLDKKGVKKSVIYAIFATILTFLFGVQTTFFEVIIYSPQAEFLSTFSLRYFMGLSFFITHILSSFISIIFLLPLLRKIPLSSVSSYQDF